MMRHPRANDKVERPFSPACERNREPIAAVLRDVFPARGRVLEIAAGTGQHAVYFAEIFPGLSWLATDRPDQHPGLRAWIDSAGLPNLSGPETLDVTQTRWPVSRIEAAFSANSAHIMDWAAVEAMLSGLGQVLAPGGVFCLYGPFRYGTVHTAQSNARFDERLRAGASGMGVRDRFAVEAVARASGLELTDDITMPANNRTLVFRRGAG